ncbi:MAG: archaeosortase/exosortase family protein, partial [Planctomycetales bacterium]|nr:archaeosortase/exosortase family protein [Planctomycetales bacterium]
MSTPLQRLSAQISGVALQTLGRPALVEGTTILLNDHVLDVERACSGLRIFYGVLALAVACVALMRPPRWQAAVLLVAAIPAAIIANVTRIVATGLLYEYVSSETAVRFSHDLAGVVTIPLAVGIFALLYQLLQRLDAKLKAGSEARWGRWVASGVVLAILAVALGWWTVRQREHVFDALKVRADQQAEAGDWQGAYASLNQYAQARRDVPDVLVRTAEIYDRLAVSYAERRQALNLFRKAWRLDPTRFDLALHAADLAIEIEQFDDAVKISRLALEEGADGKPRAGLMRDLADALHAQMLWDAPGSDATWSDVREALAKSVAEPDYPLGHAAVLAQLLRDGQRLPAEQIDSDQADALIKKLTDDYPDRASAWLARYRYRRRFVEEDQAKWESTAAEDLEQALQLGRAAGGAAAANVLTTAASESLRAGDETQAEALLREAIELAPQDPRAYVDLAELITRDGSAASYEEAAALLAGAVEAQPGVDMSLILPLSTVLARGGRLDEAAKYLAPLEEILPRVVGKRRGTIKLGVGLVRAEIESRESGPRAALARLDDLLRDNE